MSEPFIGEICVMAFNYPPKGYAQCDGQILSIAQNQALFAILGTTYGGNGQTTFALPDLRGRLPMHWGNNPQGGNVTIGQNGGETTHTLVTGEMPAHPHPLVGASAPAADQRGVVGNLYGSTANLYVGGAATATLNASTVGQVGGGQPHDNMQPYLSLNFVIALVGIFPSRN